MKILIIGRGLPTKEYVRNGVFEFDQAKALAAFGHEVSYISVDMRSVKYWRKWGLEKSTQAGVKVFNLNLPIGGIPLKWRMYISQYYTQKIFCKYFDNDSKPDIIHSHFIDIGYSSVKVFKNRGIPLVHTEHYSKMNQDEIPALFLELGNYVYNNIDKLITVSNALSDNIMDKFGISSVVLPNIVDTSIFTFSPSHINYEHDKFTFISVGNLVKNKNMDLLIYSFYMAFKNNNSVSLYIFGDGPERTKLQENIEKLGMKNQIFLQGEVKRKTIAKKMKESEAFVLVSDKETFGVAFIEALASGLPVISTRNGGTEDIVNSSNGLFVPINNSVILKEALENIYKSYSSYNRQEISESAVSKYSPVVIAKRLTSEYNKVISLNKEK